VRPPGREFAALRGAVEAKNKSSKGADMKYAIVIRSRVDFQLENVALRHQVGVLQRSLKKRRK